ncbi:AAA family ATPase [Streptomyces sp. NPDC127098]|uniref:AAA family ATPase n=1 Tax=Streptomyces sp. NPDC127098 TaxID=3347137 RepID=UPI0036526193
MTAVITHRPDGYFIGREEDVKAVAEALRPSDAAGTLLVRGEAGIGKTAVVERGRAMAVREGVPVLRITRDSDAGEAGAAELADAVCGALSEVADGRLLGHVTAIRRAQSRTVDHRGEWALLSTISEQLRDAASRAPFALLCDHVERLPPRTASALSLVLRVFRPAGVPVVLAARPTSPGPGTGELPAAAGDVLDLAPLAPEEVADLIARRLGRPADPGMLTAVRWALGPLAGNPRAVLSLLAAGAEAGGLLELDGRFGLTVPREALRLAADAAGLRRLVPRSMGPDTEAAEVATTLAHVIGNAELRLEDLYLLERHPASPADVGSRTFEGLAGEGVLTVDEDGRITFAVPAFAAALRALSPSHDVRDLHARIACSVAGRLGTATAGASHPRLTDHVAAAGPMIEDTVATPLLLAVARSHARRDPAKAMRSYRWALGRLSPHDPGTPGTLREAAGLALRNADHASALALGEPLLACLDVPHHVGPGELEFTARVWAWAALHEHRLPDSDGAGPGARTVPERMPGVAELVALGRRYGIGQGAVEPGPGRAGDPVTAGGTTQGPLPGDAELRLLAAAVTGGAEVGGATDGGGLATAAAYGDLAGALHIVLGDRYRASGDSTAGRYHAVVGGYLSGRWDEALAAARAIELRGRAGGAHGVGQLARALVAEIHCYRGDVAQARSWLDLIPDSLVHPLVVRARMGLRYGSGRADAALEDGWREARLARAGGLLAGVERVLLRLLAHALDANDPREAGRTLRELESLHEEAASALTGEAVLLAHGVLHRDVESLLAARRMIRQRGDALLEVHCHQWLAEVSDDPLPWLVKAAQGAHRLGAGRRFRGMISRAARRRDVAVPTAPRRAATWQLSEPDLHLIEMISNGATNRQIAARLACSEKTVERRLTRLFRRTGRRSRVELATAWLDGSLTRPGLLPNTPAHDRPSPTTRSTVPRPPAAG